MIANSSGKSEANLIEIVGLVLKNGDKLSGAGVNINQQDRLGRSILHLAAQYGLVKLTEKLVCDLNADTKIADLENLSPIHYAIQSRQADTFDILL